MAVVFDVRDVIAQQPFLRGVMDEPAAAPAVQPAAEGSDPERSVLVLGKRTDLIARKPLSHCEQLRLVVLEAPESLSITARPDRAVAALTQHDDGAGQRRSARDSVAQLIPVQLSEAVRGGHPEPSPFVFERIKDDPARER